MARGGGGENTKKAAGNARKAASKAEKEAVEDSKRAKQEDAEWAKGAKSSAKKEAEANKKAELAAKKAEREALLAAEEANAPSKVKSNPKAGSKKNSTPAKSTTVSRPLNLSSLDGDDDPRKAAPALNATGIDDALDALDLTATSGGGRGGGGGDRVERHPERRFKAAFTAYEARRMPEVEKENPGLRRNQRVDLIRKEFEKSEENPFNQVHIGFDASKDEVREVRQTEREKTERRLAGK